MVPQIGPSTVVACVSMLIKEWEISTQEATKGKKRKT